MRGRGYWVGASNSIMLPCIRGNEGRRGAASGGRAEGSAVGLEEEGMQGGWGLAGWGAVESEAWRGLEGGLLGVAGARRPKAQSNPGQGPGPADLCGELELGLQPRGQHARHLGRHHVTAEVDLWGGLVVGLVATAGRQGGGGFGRGGSGCDFRRSGEGPLS